MLNVDDTRINALRPLLPPAILLEDLPCEESHARQIQQWREDIGKIFRGDDDRVVVIVGPCSIHDTKAAVEYAQKLKQVESELTDDLMLVMRTYFEKPRTVVGWKGLINDPYLDNSFEINKGLRIARKLMLDVTEIGLPVGTEFLDTIIPQYIADMISWAAIGARTTESQIHRELASGLSMPVGFKNGTGGNVQMALDAVRSARCPHWFPSVTKQGVAAIFETKGNIDCHIILRGGSRTGPNFSSEIVEKTAQRHKDLDLYPQLMVDCSHANSEKNPEKQLQVASDLAGQLANGQKAIAGIMLESHLVKGRQDYDSNGESVYGQSITDACISFDETIPVLKELAKGVQERRRK